MEGNCLVCILKNYFQLQILLIRKILTIYMKGQESRLLILGMELVMPRGRANVLKLSQTHT